MTTLLTRKEAAEELRLSVRQVDRLIKSGVIPTVILGTSVRIRRVDLEAAVARLAKESTEEPTESSGEPMCSSCFRCVSDSPASGCKTPKEHG